MDKNTEQPANGVDTTSTLYQNADLANPNNNALIAAMNNKGSAALEPMDLTDNFAGEPHSKPVIVLDPGHSGQDIKHQDVTGLTDHDYPNDPEIYEVWNVAQEVGKRLEDAGYDVVFTKNAALDSVSLRDRAEIAKAAHADLAVSIHTDHTQDFDSFGQVYAQEQGLWRGGTQEDPTVVFNNQTIANESQDAAKHFEEAREQTEGHNVDVTHVNFANRPGIDPGNISQVQLYAGEGNDAVPWVYNEVGGKGFEDPAKQEAYVEGLTEAIMASVPANS